MQLQLFRSVRCVTVHFFKGLNLFLFLICFPAGADVIAQWTFNGTHSPSQGSGAVSLIGGVTATFATGSPNDLASPNSGWNTASYPAQGAGNKTAGIELRVSTRGYSDIQTAWDQRLSATASKFSRLQYAPDGVNFVDVPQGAVAAGHTLTFEHQAVSLTDIPDAADNANLALRLVAEFESTATGSGTEAYVTTYSTNNYGRSGTIRFDLLTISGTALPGGNTPPTISSLPDQTVRVGQTSNPLAVTVADAQDAPENLVVTAESSDAAVISSIAAEGSGSERIITFMAGSTPGSARVTLTVQDTGGNVATTSFTVSVLPTNTSPLISSVSTTNVIAGGSIDAIPFTVSDLETSADALTVTARSLNPDLLPNDTSHLALGGTSSNRTLAIMPAAGQAGVAPVEVTVSDGELQATSSFALLIRPSETVLLYDPFAYEDGPACSNSAGFWQNRSGTNGDCQVSGGALEVCGSRSEDVTATLPGGPYAKGKSTVLYASFRVNFVGTPRATPEYFAHFTGGSSLRGRIYASSAETWAGAVRLSVANGSTTNTALPWNLSTNTSYTVVTRYDVDTATTTAWVNPSSESDPGTAAHDDQAPVTISGYGFRQDSGLGTTVLVDDFRVGLSFAAVASTIGTGVPISIRREADNVILTWDPPGAALEFSPALDVPFTNLPGASSPFTNTMTPPAGFFRLRGQ